MHVTLRQSIRKTSKNMKSPIGEDYVVVNMHQIALLDDRCLVSAVIKQYVLTVEHLISKYIDNITNQF